MAFLPSQGGTFLSAAKGVVLMALALPLWAASATAASPGDWMIEVTLGDHRVEGLPLAWSRREVHLLGRDGQLWEFPPGEAIDFRKTSSRFQSFSTSELRATLLRELGDGFEVTGSGHYLVAHPRGQRDQWATRFEDLYRSFVHYFSVRGFKLHEPRCPLIGVVCRNQNEFIRYAAGQGISTGRGVVGYYGLDSNRIQLFDASGGSGNRDDWQLSAAVAIHEATHQTAFNTGVHNRFASPPVWVAEGLATMFEAPGVYNSRMWPRQSDRINAGRLRDFRQLMAAAPTAPWIEELVAGDDVFRRDPAAAYAQAWALTFYLVETQLAKYVKYLAMTADRPAFTTYTTAERTADFTAVFSDDWRMLEAQVARFVRGL